MLGKMIDAGMNVARLNFSHGDHESHGGCVDRLREALATRPGAQVAIMLDTKGPEIRTGLLEAGKVELIKDSIIKVTTDYTVKGNAGLMGCSYKSLTTTVKVGSTMFVADGSLTLTVTEIGDDFVMARCENGVVLGEKKNMNLPGAVVDLPTLTEKDEGDLVDFGIAYNVDFIAASFVRKASDIEYIRDVLGPKGANIKIIAKIENQEGLHNYDEILAATDGIMVARGDLGMEIPPEKVFIAQKWMIQKANIAGKPAVTATQMLESMISAPRPTRAEASDVANAVLDGSDCVMLSGECANGQYPINAVTIMSKCAIEAEQTLNYQRIYEDIRSLTPKGLSIAEGVASSAVSAANDLNLNLIIVLTDTGSLARLVAKYRPAVKILAASVNGQVVRQMSASRGVVGFKIPTFQGVDNVITAVVDAAKEQGLVSAGGRVAVVHGQNEETPDESNIFKVIEV